MNEILIECSVRENDSIDCFVVMTLFVTRFFLQTHHELLQNAITFIRVLIGENKELTSSRDPPKGLLFTFHYSDIFTWL